MNDDFFGNPDNQNQNSEPLGENTDFDGIQPTENSAPEEQVDTQTGEYHYNKQQYEAQFGSVNNNPDYSSQQTPPQNNGYSQQYGYYGQNNQQGYGYGSNNGFGGYGNQPQGTKPPKKRNTGLIVFVVIIALILLVAGGAMVSLFVSDVDYDTQIYTEQSETEKDNETIDNVDDVTATDASNAMGDAVTVANIAQKYNVGILVYSNNSLYTEGSGVILKEDSDGKYTYIVTCAHVVNYSGVALSVLMENGTEYQADLVGMDTRTDLAVVRIEASGLSAAQVASSESLVVGQTVYAVGNPGGSEFFGSVTNGIISAIGRPVSSSTGYEMECIQHTSAINPGNSGGALVNGEGKLIGINSMKIASTEYEGMGFAVPSDVVIEVFNSIIANGYVAGRAKLGISYATPSNYSQTYAMYVQMKGLPKGTIVIADINEDSDLANKDVKTGDMIVAVNGKDMTESGMLSDMIEDMSAGDKLTLTIVRVNTDDWSQKEFDITVTLVEDTGTSGAQEPAANENGGSSNMPESGQDWYDFFKEYYGY